jgi:hypothetical protein
MPVTLTRPAARRQAHQIHAEIAETGRIAETPTSAIGARRVEGRRISGTLYLGHGGKVDLRHDRLTCFTNR